MLRLPLPVLREFVSLLHLDQACRSLCLFLIFVSVNPQLISTERQRLSNPSVRSFCGFSAPMSVFLSSSIHM